MPPQTQSIKRKPGPVPGERHPGQFQKGDPRINRLGGPRKTEQRKTLEQLCREASPRAVAVLEAALDDPHATWRERMQAAEMLIIHGHGRAVDRIQVAQLSGSSQSVADVDTDVLIARMQSRLEDIDADYEVFTDEVTDNDD
jgi:hypothetical protein